MLGIVIRTLILFVFWILLSAKLDFFHLSCGLLGAAAVAAFGYARSHDAAPFPSLWQIPGMIFRSLVYAIWLLIKVILAAYHVSKLILNPKMPIDPEFIEHPTSLQKDAERVLFANSITLTPGTITADLQGSKLTVHRLDKASSEDIISHAMENAIHKILGAGPDKS